MLGQHYAEASLWVKGYGFFLLRYLIDTWHWPVTVLSLSPTTLSLNTVIPPRGRTASFKFRSLSFNFCSHSLSLSLHMSLDGGVRRGEFDSRVYLIHPSANVIRFTSPFPGSDSSLALPSLPFYLPHLFSLPFVSCKQVFTYAVFKQRSLRLGFPVKCQPPSPLGFSHRWSPGIWLGWRVWWKVWKGPLSILRRGIKGESGFYLV